MRPAPIAAGVVATVVISSPSLLRVATWCNGVLGFRCARRVFRLGLGREKLRMQFGLRLGMLAAMVGRLVVPYPRHAMPR